MFDIYAISQAIGIDTGWFGVALGLIIFYIGRMMGKEVGVRNGGEAMIDLLASNGFLKVKRKYTDENGNEVVEYAKVDE